MDNIKTGNLIKEARKQKGMTQKELADILHITDRAVSKWERGISAPDISLLQPLAQRLGVTVMEIITGEIAENPVAEGEKDTLKNIIDYSQNEIERKTTAFKRKFTGRITALVLAVVIILPAVNGIFWGEGFAWRCIPAYIQAEKAAAAIRNCDKVGIESNIARSEGMYEKLVGLQEKGVRILQADTKLSRTRLEDMFLILEVDFIVEYKDIQYKFTARGTRRNGKIELMNIVAEDLNKDYPQWMLELSETLSTYNPG